MSKTILPSLQPVTIMEQKETKSTNSILFNCVSVAQLTCIDHSENAIC